MARAPDRAAVDPMRSEPPRRARSDAPYLPYLTALARPRKLVMLHKNPTHISMTKILSILLGSAVVLAVALVARAADQPSNSQKGRLLHVVSFKFKTSATPEQIQQAESAFRALAKKVSQVKQFEWGTNVSPEKRDKGFTHCFILTFKTEKDRDDYLVHPEHTAFVKLVLPLVDDVFVLDFLAKD